MAQFCPSCGKPLPYQDAEICPSCGSQVRPRATETRVRNPLFALGLSLMFPGWGQWYNGRRWDGLKFFGAFVVIYLLIFASILLLPGQGLMAVAGSAVLGLAALGIWIYGMYDAYMTAERINRGELAFQRKSRLFWLPLVLIILGIVAIFLAAVFAAFILGMAGAPGSYEHTRSVAATARQLDETILVTWQGGMDNSMVTSYSITITYATGETVSSSDLAPNVGETNRFGGGTTSHDRVVVMASFTDGSEQVVLDTYV
jgi:hypothetical protein